VVLRDALGRVLLVNPAFERLFGYEAGCVAGADLADLVRPSPPRRTTRPNGSSAGPRSNGRPGGGVATCSLGHVTVVCIPASGGAPGPGPDDVFVIYRDISIRKQTEDLLRGAERKYRSIFENAVEGIFRPPRPDATWTSIHPWPGFTGFRAAELIEHFRDIKNQLYVDPGRRDDFVRIMGQLHEVWKLRVPGAQEGRRNHLDQRERPGRLRRGRRRRPL
jgi:Amt family ammonium transporter